MTSNLDGQAKLCTSEGSCGRRGLTGQHSCGAEVSGFWPAAGCRLLQEAGGRAQMRLAIEMDDLRLHLAESHNPTSSKWFIRSAGLKLPCCPASRTLPVALNLKHVTWLFFYAGEHRVPHLI